MQTIPSFAQSSIDPSQVSLTITSIGKAVTGALVTYAVIRGIDPMLITTNVQTVTDATQNIAAQYLAVFPALYAAYHSTLALWGIVRKLAVRLFAKAPVVSPTELSLSSSAPSTI